MSTKTHSGPHGEVRAASTAGGGTALTTTAARIVLPLGTKHMTLIPRNFSTAVVVQFNKNPWITVLKTTDLLADEANLTDYSENAQDGSAATDVDLSSLDTLANENAVYIGSHVPFSGLDVDVDAANANASVLSVDYWDGSAWSDISPTDGTISTGATFGQDGTITWTVPTDWAAAKLKDIVSTAKTGLGAGGPLFWVRLTVSAALDATTTLNSILAINRDTTYAELPSGTTWEESIQVGPKGFSSITALTDAGTANLIVNVSGDTEGRFA